MIANLDDNVQRIQKRLDRALGQAEKLGMIQEKGRQLLADFDSAIEILSRVFFYLLKRFLKNYFLDHHSHFSTIAARIWDKEFERFYRSRRRNFTLRLDFFKRSGLFT